MSKFSGFVGRLSTIVCLAAIHSACGTSGPDGSALGRSGESCINTGDCQEGLRCIDERCVTRDQVGKDAGTTDDINEGDDTPPIGDHGEDDHGAAEDSATPMDANPIDIGQANAAPTNLVYSSNPANYTVETEIPPNTPTNEGGPIESYSVSPPLPEGLFLDESTGIISGTPGTEYPLTKHIVTGTNSGGETTSDLWLTVYAKPLPWPVIRSFTADPTEVEWGEETPVRLSASFENGTGVVTPGNRTIYSGSYVSIPTDKPTTYTLTVTGDDSSIITEEVSVDTYLTGKYTYESYGSYPISAHFSFFSTGCGNFFWTRKFPDTIDSWGGTFDYVIAGTTVDLYWTNGERSGAHSPISKLGSGYLVFEGATYHK